MATQKKPTFKALARSVRKHLRQAERKARYEYLDAGKKMLEAKDKMGHDEFVQWTQQFSINAEHFMELARKDAEEQRARVEEMEARWQARWSSLPPKTKEDIASTQKRMDEQRRIREQEFEQRLQERKADAEAGLEIIKAGYRAIAAKHHPDSGGSQEAMTRLNKARERLKANV